MNATAKIATGSKSLWFGNTLVTVVIPSAGAADGLCVIEHWLPHGDSPPLHVHQTEDEIFHVISGTLRLRIADRERIAYVGETLLAPKGVPHTYRVESPEGAHCLTITRGADFETMVRQASRPAAQMDLPPAATPTPAMIARLTELCAANHIDIVGAPLG